jgi:sec-independent protein translocase protein TatC
VAKVMRRPIGHEDRLSVIDHLDELRSRLILCVVALTIAFAFCFWQNHALLGLLNRALPASPSTSANHLSGLTGDAVKEARGITQIAEGALGLAQSKTQSPADRQLFAQIAAGAAEASKSLPQSTPKRLPITIGIGEPFTTTLTVAAYFALLITLPMLIYQAYAFVIPALNPRERRVALPVMLAAPFLFIIGVVFAFFVVLPPAVHFLQGYNSQNFDILVQAKTYYTFEMLTMLGIGLAFQLPIGLLGLQQLGVISGSTLTGNWRYATVIIAVIAAAMPGVDPVTTGLEMLPLVILFLASIVLLKFADRRKARRAAAELAAIETQFHDPPDNAL